MRFYLITAKSKDTEKAQFVATQSEAASTRKALVSDGFKRADVTTAEVDVPTDKVGLLAFLNVMVQAGGNAAALHAAITSA